MKRVVDRMVNIFTAGGAAESLPLAGPAIYGIIVIVCFFGVFGGWAAFAPLDSAAVAPGVLTVTSNRRQIQHLEGGIVTRIHVGEGDTVAAGDRLVELSSTASGAAMGVLENRLLLTRVRRARLVAERIGESEIKFPKDLLHAASREAREAIASEREVFHARRRNQKVEREISERRRDQLYSLIKGIQAQNKALDQQSELIKQEYRSVADLVAKGLERQPRALALRREMAEIEREVAANAAEIARAKIQIDEIALQGIHAETTFLNNVLAALAEIESDIADSQERVLVAQDVLARTTVVAPVDGVVVDLQLTTIGGVISPGQVMLDLLPIYDSLVVEARVRADDIDVVDIGLPALVNITALNQRNTPPFMGTVTHVSADRLVDTQTGLPYYLARVNLTEALAERQDTANLKAGMNAEVRIVTGERTFLEYLVTPISNSLRTALTEE